MVNLGSNCPNCPILRGICFVWSGMITKLCTRIVALGFG